MRFFALWDNAGQSVAQRLGCYSDEQLPPAPADHEWHELDGDAAIRTLAVVDGTATSVPIVPSIELLKAARRDAAAAVLAGKLAGSCPTAIGIVQCDAEAITNIGSKVLSAAVAKMSGDHTWSQAWRRTDNSWSAALNADQMIAFAKQVEAHVEACDMTYWAIADAIHAAADAAALAAIDITAGYPA